MKLSQRLEHIYELVPECRTAADIGTDHALLPIALIERGRARCVLACDVLKGPLASAKDNVRRAGLEGQIRCLLGDGFGAMESVSDPELLPQAAIISGMGGLTIKHILEGRKAAGEQLASFVLGPQSETVALRRYLREEGIAIQAEDMVCEDGKYYPLIKACTAADGEAAAAGALGAGARPSADDAGQEADPGLQLLRDMFGPCLLAEGHPVLKEYLEHRLRTYAQVRSQLEAAGTGRAEEKLREVARDERLARLALDICEQSGRSQGLEQKDTDTEGA